MLRDTGEYGTFQSLRTDRYPTSWKNYRLGIFVFLCLGTISFVCATYNDYSFRKRLLHGPPKTRLFSTKYDELFLSIPDKDHYSQSIEYYASMPHSAGTKRDYDTAVYTKDKFIEYGLEEVEILQYFPLLSKPKDRLVEIIKPKKDVLKLEEDEIQGDNCTSHSNGMLPPFIAYSASGDVTAPVIYVNYGTFEDFKYITEHLHISLRGKIGLVRYGKNFRGLKIQLAEQYGMVGILIYSDPQEDGYERGAVYPDGLWRPKGSVQRGTGGYISVAAGDPLTPGIPATLTASRLRPNETMGLPKIVAQPLSYGEAMHIIENLSGSIAPKWWQGGLNTTYHIGENNATIVRMNINIENFISPIWNVVGKVKGIIEEDRYVIIGNHRDAWVCGAADPISGTAAMLEIIRGIHALQQNGWKPYRTLVFASWDAEEYGLIGSTEYVEDYKQELLKQAVAYINVDNIEGDIFTANGSPLLHDLLIDISKHVLYTDTSSDQQSLYEKWCSQSPMKIPLPGILGSGSDFTPFYQHLGIISADLGFSTRYAYGTYHSSMDSYPYLKQFGDPHFHSGVVLSKYWGLLSVRLADSEILPFNYSRYANELQNYVDEYEEKLPTSDWADLKERIKTFIDVAEDFHADLETNKFNQRDANDMLAFTEQGFLYSNPNDGLKHRPWFKHSIYAPGLYLGYGAVPFPGLNDAILLNDTSLQLQNEIDRISVRIGNVTSRLNAFLSTS